MNIKKGIKTIMTFRFLFQEFDLYLNQLWDSAMKKYKTVIDKFFNKIIYESNVLNLKQILIFFSKYVDTIVGNIYFNNFLVSNWVGNSIQCRV